MSLLQYPQPEFPASVQLGPLKLRTRYLLSPLAGYTNLPFRRIVRRLGGVGLATTDLVSARALLERNEKTLRLIESCKEDTPYAVQIFGNDATVMKEAAKYLEEQQVDSVDINMGCPVRRIASGGSGAGMMCSPAETVPLVQEVVEGVSIPVTVKMRLGWDDHSITAPFFAREFEQVGVKAIMIHGRTREQGFRGLVSLKGIRQVVEAVCSIPVIGNGDIRSIPDAARMLEVTRCAGVSLGRGALANPWIFKQLQQWEETGSWDVAGTFDERMELLREQLGYLEEQWGIERAIIMFRKMGHWYLKGMRVKGKLRNLFQQAKTRTELEESLRIICETGPTNNSRTDFLPQFQIPVPPGPVEKW